MLAGTGIGGSVRAAPGRRGGRLRELEGGGLSAAVVIVGTGSSHAIWTSIVCRRMGPLAGAPSSGGTLGAASDTGRFTDGDFDERLGG